MIQTTPVKPIGLRMDNLPVEQPTDSVRFALNASLEGQDGVMNYQTELGNEPIAQLPVGYSAIGHINMDDGEVVLFSVSQASSEIGILKNGLYQTVVNTPCLSFSACNPITGEFRILAGCERHVYFCDGLNADKAINLDKLDLYKNSNGDWDCNLMLLAPDYKLPYVSDIQVNNSGGSLQIGSYSFAIELLDSSLNSIAVGPATNFIPIYEDNTTLSYTEIMGSLPAIFPVAEGGSQGSNKSITLSIQNVDASFEFARLIVIAKLSSRGLAEEAYASLDYTTISQESFEITFNGLDNYVRTDVDKVRVRPIKYHSSEVMAQVDGRLVRANLTEKQKDYSSYQRSVNQIRVNWISESYLPYDNSQGAKSPNKYFGGHTFIGDEVYALGIVFIHDDGTLSPAFHIPGRAAEPIDLVGFTVGGTSVPLYEAEHLGKQIGDVVRKWEIDNTANDVGRLAYYEGRATYPETRDCTGNLIWGNLVGQAIRHHKMPDRKRIPIQDIVDGEVRLNRLGVEFTQVQYPSSDIVGHFFVSAIRREQDKTVVDTGLAVPGRLEEQGYNFSRHWVDVVGGGPTGLNLIKDTIGIVSPRFFIEGDFNASYIKSLYNIRVSGAVGPDSGSEDYQGGDIRIYADNVSFENSPNNTNAQNRVITRKQPVSPHSTFNGGFGQPINNFGYSTGIMATSLNAPIYNNEAQPDFTASLISIKNNIQPYENLNLIRYKAITNVLNLQGQQISFQGGGFINELAYLNIYNSNRAVRFNPTFTGTFSTDGRSIFSSLFSSNLWVESDLNFDLRASGTGCNANWLRNSPMEDHVITKVADFDGTDYILKPVPCREYFGYNQDYNMDNGGGTFLSIPFNFDWCSECSDKFPNRLAWSPKSFSGERADGYKINLVNDYVEIGESTGPIKTIHYDKNTLLVLTSRSAHALSPNPRVMNTDQDAVYIGTGDFLSIPPSEFARVSYGFGGCQGRLARVNTEYGFVWCDQEAGRVFYFNGQLVELSSKQFGIQGWFRENLPKRLEGYCGDSTIGGAGIQMCYDPNFKRLFIHKVDFKHIRGREAAFGDPKQFENKCFTLSYSFEYQGFISFHSWQPSYMFSDRDSFYSFGFSPICWKHDIGEPGKYYNYKFPFIVEYVAIHPRENELEVIQYHAMTKSLSGNRESDFPTFDQFIVYSDDQSTGYQNLKPKSDYMLPWSNSLKEVSRPVKAYQISKIRDLAGDGDTTSDSWEDIQNDYQGIQGYIDKVPVNIDYNRSQWKLSPLRNRYHVVRLIYNGDQKLIFNLTTTINREKLL